ncbi:MAG: protein kinase [Planctomycetes bacterium]|nr:protein kinase [Planctomycetota bacterium]
MTEQSPAEALFFAALEKGSPDERAAFLDHACGGDADLRRRVDRLLAAHPQVGSFLQPASSPVAEATAGYQGERERAGNVIAGRYKLLEKIGEGGMGEVWVADQLEPLKRRVALKLIKPGMDSRSVLGRFEAERQALAVMDHPNIARVLDAGTTTDGRPYFVMELVKGTPITEFCDARRLSARERLELLIPVCLAIQHAHMKGIIHRDIKPSNVLVALHDESPVPKVIDFGVAKAMGQQFTEKTIYTGFGALVGTPAYMAPEQATFNQLDVDTRADVYALGVLLYEMLAGSPPIEKERLKQAALDEVLRIVRDEEPPRPSQRLSTSQAKASIAATRQSDPGKLSALMQGEIDWIVMKALEKDRTRRYDTANGLAKDIQRYLAGDAVEACPPTLAYRLRKAFRKNRGTLGVVSTFVCMAIGAATVGMYLAVRSTRAETLAKQAEKEALEARMIAEMRQVQAEENAEEARRKTVQLNQEALAHFEARLDAEIRARSLQVDLDLAELKTDEKIGLLRLARPAKQTIPGAEKMKFEWIGKDNQDLPDLHAAHREWDDSRGSYNALREFVAMAVLAQGQKFASLLPSIRIGDAEIVSIDLSPNALRILTRDSDFIPRLWDSRTGRLIAVLRRADERVMHCGFSPNGETVFTDSLDGVVRLWTGLDGTYRFETEPRPNRFSWTDLNPRSIPEESAVQVSNTRLLTRSVSQKDSRLIETGPVELWDAQTGHLVTSLQIPDVEVTTMRFHFAGEKWIVGYTDPRKTPEDDLAGQTRGATGLVLSADDGRLVSRLPDFFGRPELISQSGRWLVTTHWSASGRYRAWNTETWEPRDIPEQVRVTTPAFLGNELFDRVPSRARQQQWCEVFSPDNSELLRVCPPTTVNAGGTDGMFHLESGRLVDARSWQRLIPPPGRRFHPDLAKFAADGRFVLGREDDGFGSTHYRLIDTQTDKEFNFIRADWGMASIGYLAQYGWIAVVPEMREWAGRCVYVIPTNCEAIPPAMLELWAQVAVRGELGDTGEFVKWNAEAWEQKHQELAGLPVPDPDFPFPGYLAADKLHWLRAEYAAATESDKPELASRLLNRAREIGDQAETAHWQKIVNQFADKAMPPSN